MNVVAKEFVDSDLDEQSERGDSLEKQRITATFVRVTDELGQFCHVLFVNLQHYMSARKPCKHCRVQMDYTHFGPLLLLCL